MIVGSFFGKNIISEAAEFKFDEAVRIRRQKTTRICSLRRDIRMNIVKSLARLMPCIFQFEIPQ